MPLDVPPPRARELRNLRGLWRWVYGAGLSAHAAFGGYLGLRSLRLLEGSQRAELKTQRIGALAEGCGLKRLFQKGIPPQEVACFDVRQARPLRR